MSSVPNTRFVSGPKMSTPWKTSLWKKDKVSIGAVCLIFLSLSLISWRFLGEVTLLFSLAFAIAVFATLHIETYRRTERLLERNVQRQYGQIESLLSVFSYLDIKHPLPPMRGWAISPDFANATIALILERRPELILETGSGVSTLVAGYCLKKIGSGAIISLEHKKEFAEQTANNLIRHGLQDVARVVYAPLKELEINGKPWLWYDTDFLAQIRSVQMLIVDGPPWNVQPLARYPAIPVLFDLLSEDAVVIVDDAFRKDEERILAMWLEEFNSFECQSLSTEEGAMILRKTNRSDCGMDAGVQKKGLA
jgi:hypothetical protein